MRKTVVNCDKCGVTVDSYSFAFYLDMGSNIPMGSDTETQALAEQKMKYRLYIQDLCEECAKEIYTKVTSLMKARM